VNHFFVNSQIYLVNAMFLAIKGKKSNRLSFSPFAVGVFLIKKYGNNGKMGEIKNRTRKLKELKARFLGVLKWS
jgi:hypothetical protein